MPSEQWPKPDHQDADEWLPSPKKTKMNAGGSDDGGNNDHRMSDDRENWSDASENASGAPGDHGDDRENSETHHFDPMWA